MFFTLCGCRHGAQLKYGRCALGMPLVRAGSGADNGAGAQARHLRSKKRLNRERGHLCMLECEEPQIQKPGLKRCRKKENEGPPPSGQFSRLTEPFLSSCSLRLRRA